LSDTNKSGLTDPRKRTTLKAIATGLSAATLLVAPCVFAKNKTTLRILGTHVTLQESIRERAQADLCVSIEFEPDGSATELQKASVSPGSFALYEQWSNSIRVLWQSGSIQPIDKKRIEYWYEINDLTKTGQLNKTTQFGAGDAPYKILHVQPNGGLRVDRKTVVTKGAVRSGDSYDRRFSNVAVWNTAMPTYEYSQRKWYEFMSA